MFKHRFYGILNTIYMYMCTYIIYIYIHICSLFSMSSVSIFRTIQTVADVEFALFTRFFTAYAHDGKKRRGTQIFQTSRSHLLILGARRVTGRKFHAHDPPYKICVLPANLAPSICVPLIKGILFEDESCQMYGYGIFQSGL
jgi:hypothetical protein